MSLRRSTSVVLAVALALPFAPAAAQETPGGPSSSQVERQLGDAETRLAELEAAASLAVEEVNEAQAELAATEADLEETVAATELARARAAELRTGTDAVARSLYKGGGTNLQFSSLLTAEGPTEAGARYATVQRVLRSHRGDVQELAAATTELRALEERQAEQRDAAATHTEELTERRQRLEATLADQADEVEQLETELEETRAREEAARRAAEERAAREAAERAAAARAAEEEREARERAAAEEQAAAEQQAAAAPATEPASSDTSSSSSSSSSSSTSSSSSSPPASSTPAAPSTRGSAQRAVDTALAQVGKPYQWGGGGPNSFDCSGLTSFAWRAAGVSLPHSSRMQHGATSRISRGDLQPGDLIFFGSPIHHVAMYIGGGQVVEAARTGIPVRVSSTALGRSDVVGYGRP